MKENLKFNAKEKIQVATWIEELRGDKFRQTAGQLNNGEGYCCLGVGCELFTPSKKKRLNIGGWLNGDLPEEQPFAPYWLKNIDQDFHNLTGRSLSELNDDGMSDDTRHEYFHKKFTFDEIADMIYLVYIEGALYEEVKKVNKKDIRRGDRYVLAA